MAMEVAIQTIYSIHQNSILQNIDFLSLNIEKDVVSIMDSQIPKSRNGLSLIGYSSTMSLAWRRKFCTSVQVLVRRQGDRSQEDGENIRIE